MKPFRITLVAFLFIFFFSAALIAENFYKWIDEKGITHFSDSLAGIPPKYRDQVKTNKFKKVDKPSVQTLSKDSTTDLKDSSPEEKPKKELKSYKVPYIPYEGAARRIIIQVTFNGSVTAPMVFDTGAFEMVISTKLANKLGIINSSSGKLETMIGGFGGAEKAVFTIVDKVQVGEVIDHFIPTTVHNRTFGAYEGVIGMDFLDNYDLTVDGTNKVLIFKEKPKTKNMIAGHTEKWWRSIFKKFNRYRRGWKKEIEKIKDSLKKAPTTYSNIKVPLEKQKAYAEQQYKEALKLLTKLDRYASKNSVPTHWRRH